MKLLMIFNPHAAAGRAARLLPEIVSVLSGFASVDVVQTEKAGDAEQKTAKARLGGYDGILSVGGDGTLFEVLNGLYTHDSSSRVPLGLVPVGTGNAFARDLGLMPGDWKRGIDIIRRGHRRLVDVGRVETGSEAFHFLNIIGCGLPVDAMITANKLKFLGNSAYSLATFWRAIRLKSYPFLIEIDGESLEQESMFIEVSNTRYTGTSFLIAPQAELDDGWFDITLVRKMSRLRLLRLFPTIYQGEHVRFPEVTTCKAKKIRILAPENMILAPDGEFHGATPATITCLSRNLEIFA